MAEFANPPLLSAAPADGTVMQYSLATDRWVPVVVGTLPAAVIPQTHIVAGAAPAAATSSQNATTNASAPSVGYVQAEAASAATLVNALKVSYNAAQADVAALITELGALTTKYNTLLTELQTAGILSAS